MLVPEAAAVPGHVSTTPSEILGYSFTIGDQTWSGTGADFLRVFRFEISWDVQMLFFQDAGGGLASSPGGFYLDIVTNAPIRPSGLSRKARLVRLPGPSERWDSAWSSSPRLLISGHGDPSRSCTTGRRRVS